MKPHAAARRSVFAGLQHPLKTHRRAVRRAIASFPGHCGRPPTAPTPPLNGDRHVAPENARAEATATEPEPGLHRPLTMSSPLTDTKLRVAPPFLVGQVHAAEASGQGWNRHSQSAHAVMLRQRCAPADSFSALPGLRCRHGACRRSDGVAERRAGEKTNKSNCSGANGPARPAATKQLTRRHFRGRLQNEVVQG